METTISVTLDKASHGLFLWTLEQLRDAGSMVECLELESLILIEFQRKHLGRILLAKPPYKLKLKSYEALSLRRLLFGVGFSDPLIAVTRNSLCDDINKQLPGLC